MAQLIIPGDCRCKVCYTLISTETAQRFSLMCPKCWYIDTSKLIGYTPDPFKRIREII